LLTIGATVLEEVESVRFADASLKDKTSLPDDVLAALPS